ncbi:DnaJ-domain-containing protein [Stereum hirsutum FP-91666 SS1]|uniref:DnaJ-domain-containing protein n=1 Tax=Stereum hirsutum (strain FP-91666) TaxID=721885 RepID=UPI000440E6BD|nr:DnaJ-domain-containing protein [Stereum hirsutum FP-91666 SS1]EIM87570.1 DnaJ-domain-containing protein [Stereum hirsutum FP-91666 SS1]
MANVVQIPVVPPPLPSSWTANAPSNKPIAPLVERKLIPAGPAYLAHVRRSVHNLTFEQQDKEIEEENKRLAEQNGDGFGEDDLGVGDEEEDFALMSLDPKEWKKQDHYKVLGISKLRYRANDDQIKIAHRKKVLKHHPDKKAGTAGSTTTNDDAFFKCIQKAMDILTNPEKRRQFDSVDPEFESLKDDVPSASDIKNAKDPKKAFFKEFGPVFEREARFSKKQPVPLLGTYDDTKEAVEGFYDFWYNFDSWRSFEYLDKEVNEGSDNRDDKRYTEKKNKTERARRKKEDTARLRGIVDSALALDPRIKRIKDEEKAAREAKKKSKSGTATPTNAKAQAEEEKRKAEEEAKQKEEEDKVAKAEAKKAKAAAAKAAKLARRAARQDDDGAAS